MNMPGFTADASLNRGAARYAGDDYDGRQAAGPRAGKVIPAIPACENCDWILERCEENGWQPRGLCTLCAIGWCYKQVEEPPLL